MKFNPSRIAVKHPKRLVVIIASVVLLAAIATYGVFSYNHWQHYSENKNSATLVLLSNINSSLGSKEPPSNSSAAIDTLVSDFNKSYGESPCQVSVWYSWQTIVPQLKTIRDSCDQLFANALAAIKTLKPLSQYLKDEKKAADLFTASLEATKTPTDYAAASAIWKATAESTDLSTKDNFKVVKAKSVEVASAISTAYTALATAVSKEDKAGFDTATADLKTAYSSIDGLKTTASSERTTVIKAFITAYNKL